MALLPGNAECGRSGVRHGRAKAPSGGSETFAVTSCDRDPVAEGVQQVILPIAVRWEPYARIGPVRICAGGAR